MFEHFQSDSIIINKYISAGIAFGDRFNYLFIGECSDFERILQDWEKLEEEYIKRGYRSISLNDFIDRARGFKMLEGIRVKRKIEEEPIFYAKIFKQSLPRLNNQIFA